MSAAHEITLYWATTPARCSRSHLDFETYGEVAGTQFAMDPHISLDDQPSPPYVIVEFKHEAATPALDPYVQAVAYYLEATRTHALKMSGSTLPCFLLVLFGQYSDFFALSISIHFSRTIYRFAGAVWNLCHCEGVRTITLSLQSFTFVQHVRSQSATSFQSSRQCSSAHYSLA